MTCAENYDVLNFDPSLGDNDFSDKDAANVMNCKYVIISSDHVLEKSMQTQIIIPSST